MIEYNLQERAEQFLELIVKETTIPPQEGLAGVIDLRKSKKERADSPECLAFLEGVERLLEGVPISDYFRNFLIYETGTTFCSGGLTDPEFTRKITQDMYEIYPEEDRFGFFDPKNALAVEKRFFQKTLSYLQFKENNGFYTPAPWQEWKEDLFRRQAALN